MVSFEKEVKVISFATGIRWIGWGMVEPLIPIFLFSLLNNYGMSGFIGSIGQIVFFLILPIAGILADKISLKRFLIIGLLFFLLDGFWALSAFTGMILFAVLADFFDGIAVASDVVGRATYIRRHTSQKKVASIIGFQTTIINTGWIIGALISLFAVNYISLPWIFLGIIPTNLVALYIFIRYLNNDKTDLLNKENKKIYFADYFQVWRDVTCWKNGLRFLAYLTIFFNAIAEFGTFLIPIYAYINGANLQQIIILGIIAMLPEILSSPLGKLADKKPVKILLLGLVTTAGLIFLLSFVNSYSLLLAIVLSLKITLVLLSLAIENLVTSRAEPTHYGRVSAVFEGLKDVGKLTGAIGLGFAIDIIGSNIVFIIIGFISLFIAVLIGKKFAKN